MKKLLLLMPFLFMVSCTEQSNARAFGGEVKIELPKGQKLLNATWKNNDLFYLTEPMDSNYTPKTKVFKESSSFGLMESDVVFIESE